MYKYGYQLKLLSLNQPANLCKHAISQHKGLSTNNKVMHYHKEMFLFVTIVIANTHESHVRTQHYDNMGYCYHCKGRGMVLSRAPIEGNRGRGGSRIPHRGVLLRKNVRKIFRPHPFMKPRPHTCRERDKINGKACQVFTSNQCDYVVKCIPDQTFLTTGV